MLNFDVSMENFGGLKTHVANLFVPRISAAYPNIYITLRYQLIPKTGLFLYRSEDDIECYFSPHGWDSTNGFNAAKHNLQKDISVDRKTFYFHTLIQVEFIDAKVKVGIFDSGVDFTPPHKHGFIKIDGYMNMRGIGDVTAKPA